MKTYQETIQVRTHRVDELIPITDEVHNVIRNSGITDGLVVLFVPHTTAAVTINENADPDVRSDLILGFKTTFPDNPNYRHMEGNTTAHLKSSVVGVDQTIILEEGRMKLGIWQGVYFCEFDGPRTRSLHIKIIGA